MNVFLDMLTKCPMPLPVSSIHQCDVCGVCSLLSIPLWPFLLPSINVPRGPCLEISWSGTIGWPGDSEGQHSYRIYTISSWDTQGPKFVFFFLPLSSSCSQKWGLGARWSKASKEASLVESLLYFTCQQLERGRADSCPKVDSLPRPCHPHWQPVDKGFYTQRERATYRNSSDSHPEICQQWSDQRHLDCFKYSQSSVPGQFVPSSLRPVLG